jgi:hypothetical protein
MHPIPLCANDVTRTGVARGSRGPVSLHTRLLHTLIGLFTLIGVVSCDDGPTGPIGSISIETTSLAEAIEGLSYNQQLEATGGTGGYTWLLEGGSLPAGITLAPSGVISGIPVAPGTSNFRIRATDAAGRTATADHGLSVVQTLALHTSTLPEAMMGEDYAVQLQAVGGRGARTWSITGGEAASWLSISSTGQLSGSSPASGGFMVTVEVADESGQQAERHYPITVFDPVAVAPMSLPTAVEGRLYAAQLVATGGDAMYTWEVESGALPAGVALGTVGDLLGTPEETGVFTFTARVTDGGDRVASRALTLTVERAPTIQTSSLPPGEPGVPYSAQLVATGGTGTYSWSLTDGALPDGLTLSADGAVSGTPTALGSATFTVRVTDEGAATHTRPFTIVVAEADALLDGVPVTGIEGAAGSVRYYSIEVPSGATQLTVTMSGGTGDADLYVRGGTLPAEYAYDCRPLREGNEEICTFTPPFLTAGTWYIMLRGYTAYTGVSLVASHDP